MSMHAARRRLAPLAVLAGAALLAGCAASDDAGAGARPASGGAAPGATGESIEAVVARVEREYVVPPSISRRLGYRIDWQLPMSGGRSLDRLVHVGDALFTIDAADFISRVDATSGNLVWSVPSIGSTGEIIGLNYIPVDDRVFISAGTELFVVDGATGTFTHRNAMLRLVNTPAVVYGQFLLYGSRSGELAWYSHVSRIPVQAYDVASSVELAPAVSDGYAVVVGNDGSVMSITASSASAVWRKKALDRVVAPPVAAEGVAFVASLDQHLRSYDLTTDRTPLWEHLLESPLVDAPVVIADDVYQQVPGVGIVCLEAFPIDAPAGVVRWTASGVAGTVVGRRADTLLVWDAAGRVLTVLDQRTGDRIDAYELPRVRSLLVGALRDGDVYAGGDDGRLIRLSPRG